MSYLARLADFEATEKCETPREGTDKTDETPIEVGSVSSVSTPGGDSRESRPGSVSFVSTPSGDSEKKSAPTLAELKQAAGPDWPEIEHRPEVIGALAYAIQTRRMREQGERPLSYTHAAVCSGCGPVWLWEGAPDHVEGCPWCFNRSAGRPVPAPPTGVAHEP